MSMTLKPGTRLFSAVCDAEMIVVKAPAGEIDLTMGGVAPLTSADQRQPGTTPADGHDGGVMMGKRFVDDAGELELLCTKAGVGAPAVGGELLVLKEAKPLPASD